jgi:hypothetical protein
MAPAIPASALRQRGVRIAPATSKINRLATEDEFVWRGALRPGGKFLAYVRRKGNELK